MKSEAQVYWENRYKNGDTGWDMNAISPPLKSYINQLDNKKIKILIPGAGNSYEAEYLYHKGFHNIYVADIAKIPLENLKKRIKDFPKKKLLHTDFFDIDDNFDLIIEQTFFCALPPKLRPAYAKKMHQLLVTNGRLVGLFFDFPLDKNGPPYGGNMQEYKLYFKGLFDFKTFEPCNNSYPKRQGKELFFNFLKK